VVPGGAGRRALRRRLQAHEQLPLRGEARGGGRGAHLGHGAHLRRTAALRMVPVPIYTVYIYLYTQFN